MHKRSNNYKTAGKSGVPLWVPSPTPHLPHIYPTPTPHPKLQDSSDSSHPAGHEPLSMSRPGSYLIVIGTPEMRCTGLITIIPKNLLSSSSGLLPFPSSGHSWDDCAKWHDAEVLLLHLSPPDLAGVAIFFHRSEKGWGERITFFQHLPKCWNSTLPRGFSFNFRLGFWQERQMSRPAVFWCCKQLAKDGLSGINNLVCSQLRGRLYLSSSKSGLKQMLYLDVWRICGIFSEFHAHSSIQTSQVIITVTPRRIARMKPRKEVKRHRALGW